MKTLLLAVALLGSTILALSHSSLAAPPTVSWSQPFPGSWSWAPAKQYAANLVEAGYSDWRLPTRAEYQFAITGGTLPALTPSSTYFYWTSEKQGNKAWVVSIATDAGGAVIPLQSGSASLTSQASTVIGIGIRP